MTGTKSESEKIREANRRINHRDRKRSEAAANKIRLAVPDAAAGALIDADPALDDRGETEKIAARAARNRKVR